MTPAFRPGLTRLSGKSWNKVTQPRTIALIGIGAIADLIAVALAEIPRAKLVAGSCRTEAKGNTFADRFSCKWFADAERMLDEIKPDAAIVCTPSGAHLEAVLACTAREIHVCCEKPLEITPERVQKMIDAAHLHRRPRRDGRGVRRSVDSVQVPRGAAAG